MPKVVGLPLSQAQSQLSALGLTLDVREGNDPRQPEGVVLEQNPKDGESVPPRTVVRLVVNKLATVTVPNVGGLEEAQARKVLTDAGLKPVVEKAAGGRKGVVNDQSPQPGVKVPPGTEVKIIIGA